MESISPISPSRPNFRDQWEGSVQLCQRLPEKQHKYATRKHKRIEHGTTTLSGRDQRLGHSAGKQYLLLTELNCENRNCFIPVRVCLLHSASLKAEPRRNGATRVKILYGTPPGSATRHYEFNADDCESVMDLLEISSPFFVMLTTEFIH